MLSHAFSDFDAFAESIRGVVSHMMLRNPMQRSWGLRAVDLNGIDVQVGQLGSGNIAQGEFQGSGTLLYLPLTAGVQYAANGTVLEKGSFAILEPGCEFCISTKVRHDWCAVTVPEHLFPCQRQVPQSPTVRVTAANGRAASRFRQIVGQVMAVAAKTEQFESGPAAKSAAAELVNLAAQVVPWQTSTPRVTTGRPKISREEIIARTKDLLDRCAGDLVPVSDLAASADVSERTLRTAFNDYYGVSPIRYLHLRQLHQVHRALRAAVPEERSVSDILVKNGVWEFSRFAARYCRLFGERPSDTLRTNGR